MDRGVAELMLKLAGSALRGTRVKCPVCEAGLRSFLPFGVGFKVRGNALCPVCQSLERDRAIWLHLAASEELLNSRTRLLHVAPERSLEPRLRMRLGARYVTGDLQRRDVDLNLSIEDLPFAEDSFDAVICNHVFEHVRDDRRAMAEVGRVLAPGGWALLQVPLDQTIRETREDPDLASPRERRRRFGQHDHVRAYGADYAERLRESGLVPMLHPVSGRYSDREIAFYGLDRDETLYFCRLQR